MAMNSARILVATSRSALAPSSSSSTAIHLRSAATACGGATDDVNRQRSYSSLAATCSTSPTTTEQYATAHHQQHQHQLSSTNHYQQRYFRNKRGGSKPHAKGRGGPPSSSGGDNSEFERYRFDDIDRAKKRDGKNVLVIGSSGVLGKNLVSHFAKFDWNVLGADVLPAGSDDGDNGSMMNDSNNNYICLPKDSSLSDLTGELYAGVSKSLKGGDTFKTKLDAIICASGGWAGDVDIADMMERHLADANGSELEDVDYEEEYARESAEVCERMMRVNYYPVVAGGQVGRRFMKRGGLFCIIGASAALSPTAGMLGYGSAKSAAHHYLQSSGPAYDEENDISSVGILPLMLDTPANRAMIDGEDGGGDDDNDDRFSKMVKPMHIANEIGEWIKQPSLRPHPGSLVKVIAKNRRDGTGGAAFHLVR